MGKFFRMTVLGILCGVFFGEAYADGVGISLLFEEKVRREVLIVEADGPRGIASFTTTGGAEGKGYVCCIPVPSEVRIFRHRGYAKEMIIKFTVSEDGRSLHYTVTFHNDRSVSLKVRDKR